MKTAVLVVGFVLAGVALADVLTGNTDHHILPAVIGDQLDQQTDLVLGGAGALALWFGYTHL